MFDATKEAEALLRKSSFKPIPIAGNAAVGITIPQEQMRHTNSEQVIKRLHAVPELAQFAFKELDRRPGETDTHIVVAVKTGDEKLSTYRYSKSEAQLRCCEFNLAMEKHLPLHAKQESPLPVFKIVEIKPEKDGKRYAAGMSCATVEEAEMVKRRAAKQLETPFVIVPDALSTDSLVLLAPNQEPVHFRTREIGECYLSGLAKEYDIAIRLMNDSTGQQLSPRR